MEYDAFMLYYTCWHEGEFSLLEMKQLLIDEIGQDGLTIAIAEFKKHRSERENNGDFRILYKVIKSEEESKKDETI